MTSTLNPIPWHWNWFWDLSISWIINTNRNKWLLLVYHLIVEQEVIFLTLFAEYCSLEETKSQLAYRISFNISNSNPKRKRTKNETKFRWKVGATEEKNGDSFIVPKEIGLVTSITTIPMKKKTAYTLNVFIMLYEFFSLHLALNI